MIDPVCLSLNQTRKNCRLFKCHLPKDGEYSNALLCIPENITDGKTLKTCALRPAGIYGEGELRHLPRIVVSVGKSIGIQIDRIEWEEWNGLYTCSTY